MIFLLGKKRIDKSSENSVDLDEKYEMDEETRTDYDEINIDDVLAEFSDIKGTSSDDSSWEESECDDVQQTDEEIQYFDDIKRSDTFCADEDVGETFFDIEETDVSFGGEKHKKRGRASKFAETFDTLTRSELFEDKNTEQCLETRTVQEIIKENSKLSKILAFRSACLFVLSLLSCYLAFSEPIGLYLPEIFSYVLHPFRYLFLTVFFQVCAMLLSVDVLSRGLSKLFTLKADLESAIAFSCFATLIHAVTIMLAPHWRGWLPYSCVSVVLLFVTIFGKWLGTRALCRVCKIVQGTGKPNVVHVENIFGELGIIRRNASDAKSFVAHINDRDASTVFWKILSPITIVGSLVFAGISSFGTGTPEHFFWALSGISSVSVPFFAMFSFFLPFSVTVKSLSGLGAAISGWYSATNLSKKANVIVRDEDIFPKGTVILHGLKVLGEFDLEKTIAYTASIIGETKSGLGIVFSDLLKSRYGKAEKVKSFVCHETGGIEGRIETDTVLVGTYAFMLRCGIQMSSVNPAQNSVFIAINNQLAGVFNINYKANADVERALHALVKKKIPVVLAVRDFNLLPTMVEKTFGLKDGVLEYPEIEQRMDLSEEEQFLNSDAVAIVARNGLFPVSSAVIASKKLRTATIRNVILTTACSLIGMILMFCLTFIQKPILITPHTVLAYITLWCLPVYLLSLRVR